MGLGTAAAQTTEWRFHNSYAPTRIESQHLRDLAADVRARGNGRFVLNVFEGNAMNLRDADALRYMQTGTPEMSFICPPFLGRDDAAMEGRSARFEQDATDDEAARERLRARGVTFHGAFSDADKTALRRAAISTWETLMREAGGQGPAWKQRIWRALTGQ
jgi:TRAP-type C4-dicarboxylate transport system substrate-binding protein